MMQYSRSIVFGILVLTGSFVGGYAATMGYDRVPADEVAWREEEPWVGSWTFNDIDTPGDSDGAVTFFRDGNVLAMDNRGVACQGRYIHPEGTTIQWSASNGYEFRDALRVAEPDVQFPNRKLCQGIVTFESWQMPAYIEDGSLLYPLNYTGGLFWSIPDPTVTPAP